MGVDMGLQDFRSSNQFWQELGHPEIQRYEDSSDNKWFETDPQLAWGINYSQLRAYREAKVHAGYEALVALAATKGDDGHFCWTSNIDGVFQVRRSTSRASAWPPVVMAEGGLLMRVACCAAARGV